MAEIKVKKEKSLVTKDGKEFKKGSDIFFKRKNTVNGQEQNVVCEIKKIKKDSILAIHIEIDGEQIKNPPFKREYSYENMSDIRHVYYD